MPTDRKSINSAFWDLGFRFQWDEPTWSALSALPDLGSQLRYYLERHQPHLLAAYDPEFLTRLVQDRLAGGEKTCPAMEAHRSF